MPAIDCTRYFPPGNSGTSAYHQRESADGLSFLLHPRFSGVWFFSFESMCDIVNLYSVRGRKQHYHCGNIRIHGDCNLSPQGDGNRKNSFQILTYAHCNLSPQGDKKAPLPLAFASSGGALLFPIFYFTGWELRLPGSSL